MALINKRAVSIRSESTQLGTYLRRNSHSSTHSRWRLQSFLACHICFWEYSWKEWMLHSLAVGQNSPLSSCHSWSWCFQCSDTWIWWLSLSGLLTTLVKKAKPHRSSSSWLACSSMAELFPRVPSLYSEHQRHSRLSVSLSSSSSSFASQSCSSSSPSASTRLASRENNAREVLPRAEYNLKGLIRQSLATVKRKAHWDLANITTSCLQSMQPLLKKTGKVRRLERTKGNVRVAWWRKSTMQKDRTTGVRDTKGWTT